MTSKSWRLLVRTAVVLISVCGITACFYFLPSFGQDLVNMFPEYAHSYYPWLFFLWIVAAPCFAFLVLIWLLSSSMRRDIIFTHKTARLVKISAMILFYDAVFFITGNIVFLLIGMNHPMILLISVIIAIFGFILAVLTALLSRSLTKAAALQEEVDGTI